MFSEDSVFNRDAMNSVKPNRSALARLWGVFAAFATVALPAMAVAHGDAGGTIGFAAGCLHPLGGADHLLAMLAVGLWGVQLGGRAIWALPAAFVTAMTVGSAAAFAGILLPQVEAGILLSVLLLGGLVAVGFRLPLINAVALVGLSAFYHGWAHGIEMPLAADAAGYSLGFVLATALLHCCSTALGLSWHRAGYLLAPRIAGVVIAAGGAFLAVTY